MTEPRLKPNLDATREEKDGRTFYRLRIAGFESRDEARKFCAALIAAGNDCIPAAAQ